MKLYIIVYYTCTYNFRFLRTTWKYMYLYYTISLIVTLDYKKQQRLQSINTLLPRGYLNNDMYVFSVFIRHYQYWPAVVESGVVVQQLCRYTN